MSGEILTQRDGSIATVALSAPSRLNAMNLDMWRGIAETFATLNSEENLR